MMDILPEMHEPMVLKEVEALELFTFLLASARTQLDDPSNYTSMRLLTAAEELMDFIKDRVSPESQTLLEETEPLMTRAQIYFSDTEAYRTDLDELCRMTAEFFLANSSIKGSSDE